MGAGIWGFGDWEKGIILLVVIAIEKEAEPPARDF
jgi:hypothetical protein